MIRHGATLVQSADDIFVELRGWVSSEMVVAAGVVATPAPAPPAPELGEEEALVYAVIGCQPLSLDEILAGVPQPLPVLLGALAELELLGLIESRGGTYLRAAEACAR